MSAQDTDDEFVPGLVATYSAGSDSPNRVVIKRIDPDVSFVWKEHAPDDRMADGPFKAEWNGLVLLRGEPRTRWFAYLQGKVEIRIDGKIVVAGQSDSPAWLSGDEFDFGFGEKAISITFTKIGDAAQLKLFWSSDEFPLEPLPHHILFHDQKQPELALAERGRSLFESHRCVNCHVEQHDVNTARSAPMNNPVALSAPSLKHVGSGTSSAWILEKLMNSRANSSSKMPHFSFTKDDAEAILAALLDQAQPAKLDAPVKLKESERDKDLKEGKALIRSVGCLACHSFGQLGESPSFGGGDLTNIGQHRTSEWLTTWLVNPKQINSHVRMPVVPLSDKERGQIVFALVTQDRGAQSDAAPKKDNKSNSLEQGSVTSDDEKRLLIERGKQLIHRARCAACHEFSKPMTFASLPEALTNGSLDWSKSCLIQSDAEKRRPHVPHVDFEAIKTYIATRVAGGQTTKALSDHPLSKGEEVQSPMAARRLLERMNCLACHDRDEVKGISRLAAEIAKSDETLAGLHMTLIPPRLSAVGDRMRDDALADAVVGAPKSPRLGWLRVRMPRFEHTQAERAAIVTAFVEHDRIPVRPPQDDSNIASSVRSMLNNREDQKPDPQVLLAGRELLGGKGFSCVACHAVKDYVPKVTALGTRGSNLHRIGQRMRPEYYLRWTRAPLRVMPGVEMPNYQRPHATILAGKLDEQLAAIWHSLNDPDLTAPTNPAVVEQLLTVNRGERPRIVRDVFTVAGAPEDLVPRSFAIGIENGHSALFDLDTGNLRAWTLGDFARQRCEGKRWYWDLAGMVLATRFDKQPELVFIDNKSGEVISQETGWNYETKLVEHFDDLFVYDLMVTKGDKRHLVRVRNDIQPDSGTPSYGWKRILRVFPIGVMEMTITPWHRGTPPETLHNTAAINFESFDRGDSSGLQASARPFAKRKPQAPNSDMPSFFQLQIHYSTTLERVEAANSNPTTPSLVSTNDRVTSVPGFKGERLPLPRSIMPTAMTFDDHGRLIFTSLKGHVYRVDGNGAEAADRTEKSARNPNDERVSATPSSGSKEEGAEFNRTLPTVKLTVLHEGLAAPFGVLWNSKDEAGPHPGKPSLIVAHKPELLRMFLETKNNVETVYERHVLATGWGITEDYHDWTCGIVRDSKGAFYVVTGSDYAFKARPQEKSRWRGHALRIDQGGGITSIARGLRFPTGLAMDDHDRLFVTDQQGVQNTFNELNYIQEGSRYGVPGRFEEQPDAPAEQPAIQIPHPWTRSVNGICFVPRNESVKTEDSRRASLVPANGLSSLAGHFLGVEYNNNSIIRMSIEEIDGIVQGAVYPFSKPAAETAPLSFDAAKRPMPQDSSSFIGPICIAIAPRGDIFVGSFQDGGWAGGLNMGDIVRLTSEGDLPNGIREIRATSRGFDLEFFHPVDLERASQADQYKISGYTRLWKGDYATPDSGRHSGDVKSATTDTSGRTVSLVVTGLKPGHVYDVAVGEIGRPQQRVLWPSIGYYTLHRIPK